MATNRTAVALPKVKKDWDYFDRMPKDWKDICRYGLTSYSAKGYETADINEIKRKLRQKEAESTLKVYGPDHPQARLPAEDMTRVFSGEPVNPAKRRTEMLTYAFDFTKQTIRAYPTKAEAQSAGNGALLASTPEDFLKFIVSSHEVVAFYNKFVPDAQIKKFADKQTAAKRMMALAEAKAQLVNSPAAQARQTVAKTEAPAAVVKPTKVPRAPKAERPAGASGRGRTSTFAGKRLHATKGENPRRAGSHGYKSMQIILDQPGITYEAFEKAGGRRVDLAWDVKHGAVELK